MEKQKRHTKNHSTMGAVGGPIHFCFDCNRNVINSDYMEEVETLARIELKKAKEQLKYE